MSSNEIIDISDLPKWRSDNPDVKEVLVRYSTGISRLVFNYKDPSKVTTLEGLGQYDAFGKLHFIDSEGTLHICYPHAVNRYFHRFRR